MQLISQYCGFYGQMKRAEMRVPEAVCWPIEKPYSPFAGASGAIQWISASRCSEEPGQRASEKHLLLAGWMPEEGSVCLPDLLAHQAWDTFASCVEQGAGCYVEEGCVTLWVGFASTQSAFYRITDAMIRWSTNPLDLVDATTDLDLWQLRRCCHGDDVFVFDPTKIQRVEQGYLVRIEWGKDESVRVSSMHFDRFLPDPALLAGPLTQHVVIQRTREALAQAVRPLVGNEPIGILLSGGPGSAALLAMMKHVGVQHISAYHMEPDDPAGSEAYFARLICEALDIPLTILRMDTGPDYLTPWVFSHPYGHPWARNYAQLAARLRQDGIRVLVTGAGDDSAFGPAQTYGLHSILSAQIAWREKVSIIKHLFTTDWTLGAILKSIAPSRQLIGISSLSGPKKEDREMRRADFLTPISARPRALDDIALAHAPCFAPQTMALEHAVLQPYGVSLYYPYYQRCVQAISLALPDAYKLMPNVFPQITYAAYLVDKPIVRLSFSEIPADVMWRTWLVWTQAPFQAFCVEHPDLLRSVLGSDSCLANLGLADLSRLEAVLATKETIRNNYQTLIASAMVEVFLKYAWRPQIERGGPAWQ